MSTSGNGEALTDHEETSVENEAERFSSSSATSQCLCSFLVKMPPLTSVRNKLGIGNHLMMAMQTQPTKITIDIERPVRRRGDGLELDSIEALKNEEQVLVRVWQRRGKSPIDGSFLYRKGWLEQGTYRLEDVTIQNVVNEQYLKIQFGIGSDLVPRQAKFSDNDEAMRFQTVFQKMTILEQDRATRQLEKYRSSQQEESGTFLDETARIQFLVEIVSINGIKKHIAPSVSIKMGGQVLHRTGYVNSDKSNVIYTLEDGCFFLLDMKMVELFSSGGMTFLVRSKDSMALKGDVVGHVTVPLERILNAKGERDSFKLLFAGSDKQQVEDAEGNLCIRVRRATADDVEFMTEYRIASKKKGVFAEETFLRVRPPRARDTLRVQHKPARHGENKHRVKPFPDPERPEETKWMTRTQIQQEAMNPSTHWVEASSGSIGRIYIEVIGCDGLPNMDLWNISSHISPDTFACLVFEDSIVNTDVITNSRSPRWVPWSRRAFAFNMSHPSSDVLLGLFDWDPENSPLQVAMSVASDVHDPIARILINVSNAVPNTTYTLTYPLYYGKSMEHRQKARGTITLRLRKELYDNRKALLVGASPPPQNYISVAKKNEFKVAHYTTEGDLDEEAYSMDRFTEYIEEIQSYQNVLDYIKAAALSVLFWRGHYEVTIWTRTVSIPLNSLLAFSWGILVTNNFDRFPAFCLFSAGWIMLVCNDQARQSPSPWQKARHYAPLLKALLFGSDIKGETISVDEDAEALEAYNKKLQEKAERRQREQEVEEEYARNIQEGLGNDNEDEDKIATNKHRMIPTPANLTPANLSVNTLILPFKSTLYPIQKKLRKRVLDLRIATSIVTWEERIYAFWITNIAFVAALACFWVPWALILKWIVRIAVWAILGPWAAVVARYRFPVSGYMTDEEWNESMQKRIQTRRREALEASTKIQTRNENAAKTKALARWMFGQYHLRVPRFNEQLFPDIPLSSSFAEPFDPATSAPIQIKKRLYGQKLYGDMIPKRELQVDESHSLFATKEKVFLDAGLENYFDDAYGWASFVNVTKVTYMIGYGMAKGRVYAKTNGKDAQLVGYSTLIMASAGWGVGATVSSEIIFFQDEDSFKTFSRGNFELGAGAKATVATITADLTAGTTGIPLLDQAMGIVAKEDDQKPKYHHGVATFCVSSKVGMMVGLSVEGQKFTFAPI